MQAEIIPVIRISDVKKAKDFYIEWLGFKLIEEKTPENGPIELIIAFKDSQLHLLETPAERMDSGIWLRITNFGPLIPYWKMLGYKKVQFPKPPLKPSKSRPECMSMILRDPFQNILEFWEEPKKPSV